MLDTVITLQDSPYEKVLCNGLTKSLNILDVKSIPEIVCYGLGNFSHSRPSKYQLAVLLNLKSCYHSQVYIYDPVFYSKEIQVLKTLDLKIIKTNEQAKRQAGADLTLFYMPHCYKGLIANCIWANWGQCLINKCIFMTNSFKSMADDVVEKDLEASVELIRRINNYTEEITLDNMCSEMWTEFWRDAFICTSIHVFPKEKINNTPEDFWQISETPPFSDDAGCELNKD